MLSIHQSFLRILTKSNLPKKNHYRAHETAHAANFFIKNLITSDGKNIAAEISLRIYPHCCENPLATDDLPLAVKIVTARIKDFAKQTTFLNLPRCKEVISTRTFAENELSGINLSGHIENITFYNKLA